MSNSVTILYFCFAQRICYGLYLFVKAVAKNRQMNYTLSMKCSVCPRNCNIDRAVTQGFCKSPQSVVLSRIAPHAWEEPCISGNKGSGTVFFAGCNLQCRFCQNYDISANPHGVTVSVKQLADVFLYLQSTGVANLNLVTPSHYVEQIAQALTSVKDKLTVPVVYNTSSYDKVESLRLLDGLVDVYLPDLKFCSSQISKNFANAPNYFDVATQAVCEMFRQQPDNVFDNDGYLQRGVIIRHLVLPGCVEDSKQILDWIANNYPNAYVSLMSQYFVARKDDKYPQLNRKLYRHEYDNVMQYFGNIGLTNGYCQDVQSATRDYLPDFDDTAVQQVLYLAQSFVATK